MSSNNRGSVAEHLLPEKREELPPKLPSLAWDKPASRIKNQNLKVTIFGKGNTFKDSDPVEIVEEEENSRFPLGLRVTAK